MIARTARHGLTLFLAALSTACASLPAPERSEAAVAAAAQTPRAPKVLAQEVTVLGSRGPLPEQAQVLALAPVVAGPKGDRVAHHLAVLAGSGEVNLYRGNATRLLVDGPATFAAMKAAVQAARHRVWIEKYIFEDAGIAAEFGDLLARKAQSGVPVALIVDAVGTLGTDSAFFDSLRSRGVAVCVFNPLNPLHRPGVFGINHRTHRKLLVADNTVAFTGGMNISRVYSSGSSGGGRAGSSGGGSRAAAGAEADTEGWRDTQIELRGPVVAAFAELFAQTWREQACDPALPTPALPAPAPAGDRIVKMLASDPTTEDSRIYTALLAAIQAARHSVRITMAYFAPGEAMVKALADAARRGVEVELVLPGRSDSALVLHAGRSHYRRLLDAGVRIHEMQHTVMHAKTAVIDGVLATVGSSNMDWRSFAFNNELNAVILGADFGREMEALFDRDRRDSSPVTLEVWRSRGLGQRLMEGLGRVLEPLL